MISEFEKELRNRVLILFFLIHFLMISEFEKKLRNRVLIKSALGSNIENAG